MYDTTYPREPEYQHFLTNIKQYYQKAQLKAAYASSKQKLSCKKQATKGSCNELTLYTYIFPSTTQSLINTSGVSSVPVTPSS